MRVRRAGILPAIFCRVATRKIRRQDADATNALWVCVGLAGRPAGFLAT